MMQVAGRRGWRRGYRQRTETPFWDGLVLEPLAVFHILRMGSVTKCSTNGRVEDSKAGPSVPRAARGLGSRREARGSERRQGYSLAKNTKELRLTLENFTTRIDSTATSSHTLWSGRRQSQRRWAGRSRFCGIISLFHLSILLRYAKVPVLQICLEVR
jgi:hypothetical protein